MERWGCLTVSLETEIFLPGKEAPETGRYTTQNSCRKSLKLTRFTRPLPDSISKKSSASSSLGAAKMEAEGRRSVKRLIDQTSCREATETGQAAWKRFRPESLGKDTLQPVALPAGCAVSSRFPSCCELSPMLGWDLMTQLSLNHFCSCK